MKSGNSFIRYTSIPPGRPEAREEVRGCRPSPFERYITVICMPLQEKRGRAHGVVIRQKRCRQNARAFDAIPAILEPLQNLENKRDVITICLGSPRRFQSVPYYSIIAVHTDSVGFVYSGVYHTEMIVVQVCPPFPMESSPSDQDTK